MLERIREILSQYLKIDKEKITVNSDIVTDLGADSLTLVELLFSLEEEVGITIPGDMTKQLSKVGELAAYIEENKDKKKAKKQTETVSVTLAQNSGLSPKELKKLKKQEKKDEKARQKAERNK